MSRSPDTSASEPKRSSDLFTFNPKRAFGLHEEGRLVIEPPHWTAVVELKDNDLVSRSQALIVERRLFGQSRLQAVLPPGLYQIQATLSGISEAVWVAVESGSETLVSKAAWNLLKIQCSLPSVDAGTSRALSQAARKESRRPPSGTVGAGGAQLFIFFEPEQRLQGQLRALSLRNADGSDIAAFAEAAARSDNAGYASIHLALDPGDYVLRETPGPDRPARNQALHLSAGWQGQVFLDDRADALLQSWMFNISDPKEGFRPGSDETIAAAALLTALGQDNPAPLLGGNHRIVRLLRRRHSEPWLGLVAAYCLAQIDADQAMDTAEPVAEAVPAERPITMASLLGELRRQLGDHPDVLALTSGNVHPVNAPPMLRAGLRRLQRRASRHAGTFAAGSLTDRISDFLLGDTPWTSWRDLDEATFGELTAAPAWETSANTAVLQQSFSAKAPIFPLNPPSTSARLDAAQAVSEAGLVGAAVRVLNRPDHDARAVGALTPMADEGESIRSILADLSPARVSRMTGAPISRVTADLQRLRSALGDAGESVTARSSGDVLSQSVVAAVMQIAGSADPMAPTATFGATQPPQADVPPADAFATERTTRSIEEHAQDLLNQVDHLQSVIKDEKASPASRETAGRLSGRLKSLAERLLERADLVAVSDPQHRLLYANGALQTLMASTATSLPIDTREDLDAALKDSRAAIGRFVQVHGRAVGSVQDVTHWRAATTVVQEVGTGAVKGYVHLLNQEGTALPGVEVLAKIGQAAPKLALQTGLFAHGSADARERYGDALTRLVDDLENTINGDIANG
ncbi:MAG TPA: hypothetical protein VF559_04565 [Caulobacteraceae bacterium]|jgi:hypothetical protein